MFIFLVIRFGISWDPEIRAMLTTMRPGVDFSEYQHFSSISILLMSAFLYYQHSPSVSISVDLSTPRTSTYPCHEHSPGTSTHAPGISTLLASARVLGRERFAS
jgi:hypothetical protein